MPSCCLIKCKRFLLQLHHPFPFRRNPCIPVNFIKILTNNLDRMMLLDICPGFFSYFLPRFRMIQQIFQNIIYRCWAGIFFRKSPNCILYKRRTFHRHMVRRMHNMYSLSYMKLNLHLVLTVPSQRT